MDEQIGLPCPLRDPCRRKSSADEARCFVCQARGVERCPAAWKQLLSRPAAAALQRGWNRVSP
jgi:hypothetical protein